MDAHEHTLRKSLRSAIEEAMTAGLSIGDAVEVAVLAAEIFATANRNRNEPAVIHVVTWPAEGHFPMRKAMGYRKAEDAHAKRESTDDAQIWMLELI